MDRITCNENSLQEVSKELGVDIKLVKAIIDSQSEYTKNIMESNSFDSVRWPYFGIFKSKPKEVQMLSYLAGMTPEQQRDFKRAVRTKQIVLNHWEKNGRDKKKINIRPTNSEEDNKG